MSVSQQVDYMLKMIGVGKRHPKEDILLKENKILEPLTKRYGVFDLDEEELCHEFIPISCHIRRCGKQFNTVLEFDDHYNSAHRFVCNECKSQWASSHLLSLHIEESHDSFFAAMAERKPSYSCYEEDCKEKFTIPDERRTHCIETHKFPPDFRYENKKKKPPGRKRRGKPQVKAEPMECDQNPETSEKKDVKKFKNFSFGHSKVKGFSSSGYVFGQQNKKKNTNEKTVLDSDDALMDLKDSLPE